MSAVARWFDIFYKNYICLNLKSYENIGIDFEIVKIILAIALAAVISGIILDYHNKYTYVLIKQLLRHEAVSEDKAKTLTELGLSNMRAVKCALSDSGKIKSIVARCGEKSISYEEYLERERAYKAERRKNKRLKREEFFGKDIDFAQARFYIKEESKPAAMRIFNGADVSSVRTLMRSALIIIVSVIIVMLMPNLLSLINNLLG